MPCRAVPGGPFGKDYFWLCWLWQEWMAEEKPWASFEAPCNEVVRFLFNSPVRLSYELYCFSEGTVFFSHDKSVNSTFSHGFSAKRTGPTTPPQSPSAMETKLNFGTTADSKVRPRGTLHLTYSNLPEGRIERYIKS